MLGSAAMGAQTHRELDAWRLADQFRAKVVAVTATPPSSRDLSIAIRYAMLLRQYRRTSPRDSQDAVLEISRDSYRLRRDPLPRPKIEFSMG